MSYEVLSARMVYLNECDREAGKPPRFNTHEPCEGYGCDACEQRGWIFEAPTTQNGVTEP